MNQHAIVLFGDRGDCGVGTVVTPMVMHPIDFSCNAQTLAGCSENTEELTNIGGIDAIMNARQDHDVVASQKAGA